MTRPVPRITGFMPPHSWKFHNWAEDRQQANPVIRTDFKLWLPMWKRPLSDTAAVEGEGGRFRGGQAAGRISHEAGGRSLSPLNNALMERWRWR